MSTYACNEAARSGHLGVLKRARENGCPWDTMTCALAAEGGHLDVLRWARENGCSWDADTCAHAAHGNHLDVLKWARENGCPWNIWTSVYAAGNGHLDMLRWAIENGCPWNSVVMLRTIPQLIVLGCFIGKSCTVLGCQTTTEKETHLCDDHTELVRDILASVFYDDVLQLIVEMTAAC